MDEAEKNPLSEMASTTMHQQRLGKRKMRLGWVALFVESRSRGRKGDEST